MGRAGVQPYGGKVIINVTFYHLVKAKLIVLKYSINYRHCLFQFGCECGSEALTACRCPFPMLAIKWSNSTTYVRTIGNETLISRPAKDDLVL